MTFETPSQPDSRRWREKVGENSQLSEEAANNYWQEMPKVQALRLLGKYAVFLKDQGEEAYESALERARAQLGLAGRDQILKAPKYSTNYVEKGNSITGYLNSFFKNLGSKKPLEDAKLATHYLNKYYKVDRLEVGDRVEISGGYFHIWDKTGKQVSNFPFVKVYNIPSPGQTVRESAKPEPNEKNNEKKSATENTTATTFKTPIDSMIDDSDLIEEAINPPIKSQTKVKKKQGATITTTTPDTSDKPNKPEKLKKTIKFDDLLRTESPTEKKEKAKRALLDREKIYRLLDSTPMLRILYALEKSQYKVKIKFKKGEGPEGEPQIISSFGGKFAGRNYNNPQATIHTFKGNGKMHTEVFGKNGDSKGTRENQISEITTDPIGFIKKNINETFNNLPLWMKIFAGTIKNDLLNIIDSQTS